MRRHHSRHWLRRFVPRAQIDVDELYSYVKYLGHKCPKKEIEDMIWEVDENGDGCIQWEEFKVMCATACHRVGVCGTTLRRVGVCGTTLAASLRSRFLHAPHQV